MAEQVEQLTFEAALQQLEDVVRRLERGDLTLEESVELYEKGMRLSLICEAKLKTVEQKFEMLTGVPGQESKTPFLPSEE